jgi:hypothetical protein
MFHHCEETRLQLNGGQRRFESKFLGKALPQHEKAHRSQQCEEPNYQGEPLQLSVKSNLPTVPESIELLGARNSSFHHSTSALFFQYIFGVHELS